MGDRSSRGGIVAAARRELERMGASWVSPALLLVLPLLTFGTLWATFAAGVPQDLPVAVVDLDHSRLSRRVTEMVDATSAARVATVATDLGEAESELRQGRVYGVLVLPEGMASDVVRGRSPKVTFASNAEMLLPASILNRTVRTTVATVAKGLQVASREARGDAPVQALAAATALRLDVRTLHNPELSYLYFLFAALLPALLQIFILLDVVWAFGAELRDGEAAGWLAAARDSLPRAVLGKLAPHAVAALALTLGGLGFVYAVVGVPFAGSRLTVLAGSVLFVLALQVMGMTLVAFLANLRLALSAAAFLSSPAFAFSGTTFPTFAMPLAGRIWGAILPLTHLLRLLVDQAQRGAPAAVSRAPLAALAAFTLLAPLALLRLRAVARLERYWRRS
jgi:ABC-2 type transport system permease protein